MSKSRGYWNEKRREQKPDIGSSTQDDCSEARRRVAAQLAKDQQNLYPLYRPTWDDYDAVRRERDERYHHRHLIFACVGSILIGLVFGFIFAVRLFG